MPRTVSIIALLCSLSLLMTACEKQTETQPSSHASHDTPSNPSEGAAPQLVAEESSPPTVETFATQLASASCDWLQRCKNEELVHEVQGSMAMAMAISAPVMRPDLKAEIDRATATFKKMKDKKSRRVSPKQCQSIMTTATKVIHLDSASLEKSVKAGRVSFDQEAASKCIEAFRKESELCSVETEADLTRPYVAAEATYTAPFQALTQPCKEALRGLVEVGGECEESYECKGEERRCNFTKHTCR